MDEQPQGLIARLVRFLKVDPGELRSPSVIRPKGTTALPRRIPAAQVLQSPRPGPRPNKK